MQKPAITEAKKLGCRVAAVDGNPQAVAASLADEFQPIDLKDIPALIGFAQKLKAGSGLDAVFTAATDFSVSAAAVAEACGLPGHSPEAAKNATDKVLMRRCFLRGGVPSPYFCEFTEKDIPGAAAILKTESLSFPFVVKPADNMGARGCRLVLRKSDFIPALEEAVKFSRSKKAIAENFINGEEFSLEGLIFGGKLFVTALADRHIFFPPYFVEMGHTIPSRISAEEAEELINVFSLGVKSLGLTHGAVKGDIFLQKSKQGSKCSAFAGEIAARLSGGYMSGWTVPYSSGINITRAAVRLALGEAPYEELFINGSADRKAQSFVTPLKDNSKQFSAERAWISVPGKISEVYGLEEASNVCFVKDVIPRYGKNNEVCFPKNNVEKCGNVLTSAPSYAQAVTAAENAIQKITLRLEPNNPQTEEFLNSANEIFETQHEYPPNFFIFPIIEEFRERKIMNEVLSSGFEKEDGIIFPAFFKRFLDSVHELHGKSLREALKQISTIAPEIFKRLNILIEQKDEAAEAALLRFWTAFIRAGVQGALYVYDSGSF